MANIIRTKAVILSKKKNITVNFQFEIEDLKGVIENEAQGYTDVVLPGGVFTITEDYDDMVALFDFNKNRK